MMCAKCMIGVELYIQFVFVNRWIFIAKMTCTQEWRKMQSHVIHEKRGRNKPKLYINCQTLWTKKREKKIVKSISYKNNKAFQHEIHVQDLKSLWLKMHFLFKFCDLLFFIREIGNPTYYGSPERSNHNHFFYEK